MNLNLTWSRRWRLHDHMRVHASRGCTEAVPHRCAMVVNKLLASFIYFFLFLNAEYSPDSDKGAAAHPFAIPVWVHAAAFNLHVVVWCSFILCWLGDPGVIKGTTAEVELTKAYDAYFDRLVTGERDDDAVAKLSRDASTLM